MDSRNASPRSASSARCARCGRAFDCGGTTQPFDCWCASMPALPAPVATGANARQRKARCLCPACYADELAGEGAAAGSADQGAVREH